MDKPRFMLQNVCSPSQAFGHGETWSIFWMSLIAAHTHLVTVKTITSCVVYVQHIVMSMRCMLNIALSAFSSAWSGHYTQTLIYLTTLSTSHASFSSPWNWMDLLCNIRICIYNWSPPNLLHCSRPAWLHDSLTYYCCNYIIKSLLKINVYIYRERKKRNAPPVTGNC